MIFKNHKISKQKETNKILHNDEKWKLFLLDHKQDYST